MHIQGKKGMFKCLFALITSRSVKTLQTYLGDTVSSVPDHRNKTNIMIK